MGPLTHFFGCMEEDGAKVDTLQTTVLRLG